MHDPSTVAFELRYPWRAYRHPRNEFEKGYRNSWCTIWHVDPCKDGTDDSCGWFQRARHGDKAVLEKIVKRFEMDWDRVFESDGGTSYPCGYFLPNGDPHFSVHGIVLNLFFMAAIEVFSGEPGEWGKAKRYMHRHLVDILIFAENPVDSLHDGITRKFEWGCKEPYTKRARDERIRSMAGCIYAWILRDIRPWYRHPRWHIHHWKVQFHFFDRIRNKAKAQAVQCDQVPENPA